MKINARRLFALSATDSEYFNDKQDKIQLLSCAGQEMRCKKHLMVINSNYHESDYYLREKDFQRAIEKLKNAFYKTTELTDVQCLKCSALFRTTITDSLKTIKEELRKMNSGFWGNNHYQSSYVLADNVLQELEKVALCSTVERKKSKDHFIDSYLTKSVS